MKKFYKILLTAVMIFLCVSVLTNPKMYISSVKDSLIKCYTTLIPSLITFMTLSNLVCESKAGAVISRLLAPVIKKVFHLNRNCGKIILMSLIGGYPSGSKMIQSALEKGEIDLNCAQTLMCFCINASPAYVISAVGIGLFSDIRLGVALYISHAVSALLIGVILRPKTILPDKEDKSLDFPNALVKSVSDSTNAMILICGFFLTFSPLVKLIETLIQNPAIKTTALVLFDTVTGVYTCASLGGVWSVVLTGASLSFGGMSIIFQCMAMLKQTKLNLKKIILFRFLHSLLTAAVSYFIINIMNVSYNNTSIPITLSANNSLLSLALVGCCVFFLFSLGRYKQ